MEDIVDALAQLPICSGRVEFAELKQRIVDERSAAVAQGDEVQAKRAWCLLRVLKVHWGYVGAFDSMKSGAFFDAWCSLDRAEGHLTAVARHLREPSLEHGLSLVAELLPRWQALYPYNYFSSLEMVIDELACTICGARVTPRADCGHRVGEVYGGRLAGRTPKSVGRIVASALVTEPEHRYAVLFPVDPETDEQVDPYNYSTLRWIIERLSSPYHRWGYTTSTRTYTEDDLRAVGRNDLCPCGSGKKYKKCCLPRGSVSGPHVSVWFEVPPKHAGSPAVQLEPPKQNWPKDSRTMRVMLLVANDGDDD